MIRPSRKSGISLQRKESNEPAVVSLHSSERVAIGGFEFTLDSPTGNRVFRSEDGGFSIEVDQRVFLSDAEALLKTLRNRVTEIRGISPTHFYVGTPFPPERPLASMDEETGAVRFYRDDHGGLLSVGYFRSAEPDNVGARLDELLVHECALGFQRKGWPVLGQPIIRTASLPNRSSTIFEHARFRGSGRSY